MDEVSLILKNNLKISDKEFDILDKYSHFGHFWLLIQKYEVPHCIIRQRTTEYILDPETFIFFKIISDNILASWDTDMTRNILPDQEFQLEETIFIKPYIKYS